MPAMKTVIASHTKTTLETDTRFYSPLVLIPFPFVPIALKSPPKLSTFGIADRAVKDGDDVDRGALNAAAEATKRVKILKTFIARKRGAVVVWCCYGGVGEDVSKRSQSEKIMDFKPVNYIQARAPAHKTQHGATVTINRKGNSQ